MDKQKKNEIADKQEEFTTQYDEVQKSKKVERLDSYFDGKGVYRIFCVK